MPNSGTVSLDVVALAVAVVVVAVALVATFDDDGTLLRGEATLAEETAAAAATAMDDDEVDAVRIGDAGGSDAPSAVNSAVELLRDIASGVDVVAGSVAVPSLECQYTYRIASSSHRTPNFSFGFTRKCCNNICSI